jgi:hypothetical protein
LAKTAQTLVHNMITLNTGDRPPNEFGGFCKSYAEAFVEFRSG